MGLHDSLCVGHAPGDYFYTIALILWQYALESRERFWTDQKPHVVIAGE
jgi:hypothetical protein